MIVFIARGLLMFLNSIAALVMITLVLMVGVDYLSLQELQSPDHPWLYIALSAVAVSAVSQFGLSIPYNKCLRVR